MATLILEVLSRHDSRFFPIDKPVLRVGRALDNDIILTDPAVSPHHFLIRAGLQGAYELVSLADENGIRLGRRRIEDKLVLDAPPIEFDAGRTRFRILERSTPVAPTRLISCRNGGACLFGHWGWALALFLLMFVFSAYENYLSTPRVLTWETYWRDQVAITGTALGLSLGLLLINRITSHRWDYPAVLSFTSLALIFSFSIDQAVSLADYFFSSPMPGFVANLAWALVLLPLASAWFLIRLNHGNRILSWALIVMLFTPSVYVQFKEIASHYDLFNSFSKKTHYSNALYPWDIRLQATTTIDEFVANNLLGDNDSVDRDTSAKK